tara:strand:- start:1103 stop:1399 length:297 start_codon:yes stop_codon:yes gene_type:complete
VYALSGNSVNDFDDTKIIISDVFFKIKNFLILNVEKTSQELIKKDFLWSNFFKISKIVKACPFVFLFKKCNLNFLLFKYLVYLFFFNKIIFFFFIRQK